MKRLAFILAAIALLESFSLSAQEFRFTGFWDYYGGIEPSEGYENLRSRIYMRPYFNGYDDDTVLEWTLSARLWTQWEGDEESIKPADILDEAYLFLPAGNFDFFLGQKLITTGFADVYGPLNALHSKNSVLLSLDESYDNRRADPLFQVKYYPTFSDTLEFIYVPVTRPDREQAEDVYLPDTLDTIEWSDDAYLTDRLHSFFFCYSRYGEKMDWQFLYGNYVENTPDFTFEVINSATPSVITPVYNRKQTIGLAYSTGLGNTTLSQDFALNITDNWEGKDIGAQYSDITVNTQLLANLPWDILSQTSIVYSYFINFGKEDDGADKAATDYLAEQIRGFHDQPLQQIAFVVEHMEKSFFREKLKAQLNAALLYPRIYLAPRAAFSLTDFWSFETGADIFLSDPPDEDLRRNPSDDNYYLRIAYRY